MKKCDHTSVGMLIWQNDKLLLIERQRFPYGYAPPSGHVDEDSSYEEAAKRELQEEVGLHATKLELIASERKNNVCCRIDGTFHDWNIYKVIVSGDVKIDVHEVKQVNWYTIDDMRKLSRLTERYLQGKISDSNWEKKPGIETIWFEWFKQLKII